MRDLIRVLAVCGVALAAIFAALVLGGDATTAVSPPEAVSEQFARQVAARRYDRALQYVDEGSGITLTTVRLAGMALEKRGGKVNQVEGEPGRIDGNRATASAVLITERAGRVRFTFGLVRTSHVWKIVTWEIF